MKTLALPIGVLSILAAIAVDGLSISAAVLIVLVELFAIRYLIKSVE